MARALDSDIESDMRNFLLGPFSLASVRDHPRIAKAFAEAEQNGLRIAIKCRLAALALLGIYFIISRALDPERALAYSVAVIGFGALGALHHWLIGSRYDRPWIKYAFVTVDFAVLSGLVATQPVFPTVDLPQAVIFHLPIFPFFFVALAIAAFSFSPGLVLWSGVAGVCGWLGAFAWSIRDMPIRYDWRSMGASPTTETFSQLFFTPNFIGTGSRTQESIAFFIVALLIATVMWRARGIVRRQLELEEERREISEVFGKYVPKVIADALIADRGLLEPVEKTATIMFVDIAGFTKLSEAAGARRTVSVLNEFFDQAVRIISQRHGVITQFQGDAILAMFNLPVEDPRHAANALLAALGIADAVRNGTFNGERLSIRVGICTGPVIAGSVGGGGRQNYTVYGDTVNLAARLEALNKEHKTELLVDGPTVALLDGAPFRAIGALPVRGFSAPVPVYTAVGETWEHLSRAGDHSNSKLHMP
jgi:class 3 adenylate cyclase